jgi:hypothetical protein
VPLSGELQGCRAPRTRFQAVRKAVRHPTQMAPNDVPATSYLVVLPRRSTLIGKATAMPSEAGIIRTDQLAADAASEPARQPRVADEHVTAVPELGAVPEAVDFTSRAWVAPARRTSGEDPGLDRGSMPPQPRKRRRPSVASSMGTSLLGSG